jgi:hypothetical protein
MPQLRSQTLRLAASLPKGDPTRRKLLASLKETASNKQGGVYSEMIWKLIDKRGFYKTFGALQKTDPASAKLLRQVAQKLMAALDLSDDEAQAMNRLSQVVENQGRWDEALMRNNIFKAANSLGISLPHGMF